MKRRRGALAATAVALAITTAACGGGGGTDASVSIKTLRAAASNTQAATSTAFTMTMKMSAQGRDFEFNGSGVASSDGKYAQVSLTMGDLGQFEERLTPDGIYLDFGAFAAVSGELPDGKHWVFMSYDAMKAETGTDLRELTEQNSPQQGLEYLRSAGDVTEVGPDTVNGAPATHYTVTVDYAKAAEKLGDASAELRDRMAELGDAPADVWIDDHDRVVKMKYVMDASAFGGKSGSAEMTMEITGFDVPVDVQTPPADETVDFSALTSQEA